MSLIFKKNCFDVSDNDLGYDIGFGTSASPIALADAGDKLMQLYSSSASTSASTSVQPIYSYINMTGVGGVGGRAKFEMYTNVALGGWSNALKAEVTYGASGRTTGLGSAFCAEMTLSAGTSSGTYAPIEIELNMGTAGSCGTATSIFYTSINGTAATTFDTSGLLFNIQGVTPAATKFCVLDGDEPTWNEQTVYIKSKINSTTIYLLGVTAQTVD